MIYKTYNEKLNRFRFYEKEEHIPIDEVIMNVSDNDVNVEVTLPPQPRSEFAAWTYNDFINERNGFINKHNDVFNNNEKNLQGYMALHKQVEETMKKIKTEFPKRKSLSKEEFDHNNPCNQVYNEEHAMFMRSINKLKSSYEQSNGLCEIKTEDENESVADEKVGWEKQYIKNELDAFENKLSRSKIDYEDYKYKAGNFGTSDFFNRTFTPGTVENPVKEKVKF